MNKLEIIIFKNENEDITRMMLSRVWESQDDSGLHIRKTIIGDFNLRDLADKLEVVMCYE